MEYEVFHVAQNTTNFGAISFIMGTTLPSRRTYLREGASGRQYASLTTLISIVRQEYYGCPAQFKCPVFARDTLLLYGCCHWVGRRLPAPRPPLPRERTCDGSGIPRSLLSSGFFGRSNNAEAARIFLLGISRLSGYKTRCAAKLGRSDRRMQRGERLGNQGAMWAVQLLMIVSMWVSLGQTGRPRREGRNQCFAAEELDIPGNVLQKLLRRANAGHLLSVNLVEQLERQQMRQGHCPKMGHQSIHNPKIRHRSISPWEYRIDYDENRYPSKLAFARCLCDGCIDAESGEETLALNSVLLKQSMLVLQSVLSIPDSDATS
ncbi:uncharacterized protein [Hemitrygon akajei]|uniref:uncharacterized protein n=1 Tax=Hemitrygon akajei TaxID=2704970 RepID=UPI003BFA1234